MTITVSQKLNTGSYSSEFGVTTTPAETETEVSYTVSRIINFDGDSITAEYSVSIDSVPVVSPFRFTFKYSGSGNPMDQAEAALKSYLDSAS